ncbi:hypothetical protein D9M68_903420 [compost metagenome]
MFQQGGAIHQQRVGLRQVRAQAVEDGQTVGVDIAPVMQRLLVQPGDFAEAFQRVALTENHQCPFVGGKGQGVGFVLGDEHPRKIEL